MKIVSRAEWGARKARSRHAIDTPTADLYLHHTAGALDENGNGVWWDDVRGIQNFHMDRKGWSDIAYSFLIGGGQVFEGRGVGIAGGHTKGHNSTSHAICVVGNYEWMKPTSADLVAIADLVAHGARSGWWPARITGGHRDVGQTACPGLNLYEAIPSINRMVADRLDEGAELNKEETERLKRVEMRAQAAHETSLRVEELLKKIQQQLAKK